MRGQAIAQAERAAAVMRMTAGREVDVSYIIPGVRANGGARFGQIWGAPPLRVAQRYGLKALRPVAPDNGEFSANAALRKDEWILLDQVVNQPRREELVGFSSIAGRGLTFNLGNPMGTTVIEWEDHGEVSPASVHMLAGTMSEDDLVDHGLRGIPVPIVSKGFTLDERVLETGRMRGTPIDVTNADAATRQVALAIDGLFFNANLAYGGYTLYGFTEHPQRVTAAHGTNGLWTAGAKTAQNILDDVLTMIGALYVAKVTGPFELFIPASYWIVLQDDFKAEGDDTLMERILKIQGLESIKVSYQLTNEVVLVSMQRQTVDAAVGFQPTLVQWQTQGGAINHFRVMSIIVPRVKRDYDGTSGIYHMVGT